MYSPYNWLSVGENEQKCLIMIRLSLYIFIPLLVVSHPIGFDELTHRMAAPGQDQGRYQRFILEEHLKMIEEHNARPKVRYKLKANELATLSEKQIKQKYFGLIPSIPASISLARVLVNQFSGVIQDENPQNKGKSSKEQSRPVLATSGNNVPIKVASLKRSMSKSKANAIEQPVENEQGAITADQMEREVLNTVREFLAKRDVPQSRIESEIIPSFRARANLKGMVVREPSRKLSEFSQSNNLKDVDWTCVSGRVRAQGGCGACYAFATADSVSAFLAIYHYTFFVELSIQDILDCSHNSLVFGCEGGFLEGAFAHMISPGIHSEYTYPFAPGQPKQCESLEKYPKFRISGFQAIQGGNCQDLRKSLQKGPVSVAIAGYKLSFYSSGVFDGCDPDEQIDHAALLVGWKAGVGWKIKNSWGIKWGQAGYAWLADNNTCRICEIGFYPLPSTTNGRAGFQSGSPQRNCSPP